MSQYTKSPQGAVSNGAKAAQSIGQTAYPAGLIAAEFVAQSAINAAEKRRMQNVPSLELGADFLGDG